MKNTIILFFTAFGILCYSQKDFNPKNSTILSKEVGDLDNDKIPEKVIVYNIKSNKGEGDLREIQILKKVKGKWIILEKSRNAILKSDEGGMMGDPFNYVKIKSGTLIINHYGGSSWKWNVTDIYRFQNHHFELIGYHSEGGRSEDYWATTDFNIIKGKLIYKKTVTDKINPENGKSESEIYYKKGIKLNLKNRNLKKIKFVLPKTKREIYL